MSRVRILVSLGIAAIASALLYVGDGSSDDMVWTYQDCVTFTYSPRHCRWGESCGGPVGAGTCLRFEPRLRPWVYTWTIQSVLVAIIIAVLTPSLRLPADGA